MKILVTLILTLTLLGCGRQAAQLIEKQSPTQENKRTLSCNANFQPGGPGTAVSKQELAVENQDSESIAMAIVHQGYSFKVNWHYSLTTLYMLIKKGDVDVVSATARVPDPNHNDSMLDAFGPPRVWLSCDIVEYRPKH